MIYDLNFTLQTYDFSLSNKVVYTLIVAYGKIFPHHSPLHTWEPEP